MKYQERILKAPKESFFLFGPRGTGKSTWLKHHFPDALLVDLLEIAVYRRYESHPERLRELVEGNPEKKVVIIDEVQKIPALLSMVHALIEEKRGLQFILTGSSSRKLKRTGVDLLAGRALLHFMHPFVANELGAAFSLEKALLIGMLPLVWQAKNPTKVLEAYAGLYLKEEVQEEGLVRNIGNFARFLEVISFSHASVLNTANVARECEVKRKTVEGYLSILEDLLLSFTLSVFTKRAQRVLTSHPKFYLFDAGVYRSLRPKGIIDKPEEIGGCALEGLVAEHLRTWIHGQQERHELFFWRTRAGLEVDFILYGPRGFWAIEVKHNSHLSPLDFKGLKAFMRDYPEATPILLYNGKERLKRDGIYCLPCETFLKRITPKTLLFSTS